MNEKTEIIVGARTGQITPLSLIEKAMMANASIEQMQQLFELQLRWEQNEAFKAFNAALSAFKAESITILKDKTVGFTGQNGTFVGYKHASLGAIIKTIIPCLARHELNHSWDLFQKDAVITVTCKLRHSLGHVESVSMSGGKDDTGKKNAIQQIASTVTYLQRYTLLAITGLAAEDQDNDGNSGAADVEVITEEQSLNIEALLSEVGVKNDAFCAFYKISNIMQLSASKYSGAVKKLEAKRGK